MMPKQCKMLQLRKGHLAYLLALKRANGEHISLALFTGAYKNLCQYVYELSEALFPNRKELSHIQIKCELLF